MKVGVFVRGRLEKRLRLVCSSECRGRLRDDIKRRVVTCQSNGKSKVSGEESGIGEVRNSRGEEKWRPEVSRECERWSEAGVMKAMRGRGGG